MGHTRAAVLAVVLAVTVLGLATDGQAQLQSGFYTGKCRGSDVEAVVQGIVQARFASNSDIVAHLLRLLFHECGVNGCDGGLLIDGYSTEKTAKPNLSVKGYELITAIKTELEKRCPGVVSCSDIEVLATRDAVAASTGRRYAVRTGRRDSRRSVATDVNLPGPDDTVPKAAAFFRNLGLTSDDMVVLLGAHTVGVTHCSMIKRSRLYSASKVDNSFYKMLQQRRGVLMVDQNLYNDSSTRWMVDRLANTDHFNWLFPQALVKLGEVKVLTATQGEVRRVCSRFN
ncbi:unnamed protein product [Triticum turgidum subsp. durum]|uniref:Peroxidase n=1 Tax=Triticum turgidum subsp. durum TaxID=4567 RepID=A0A9R0U191_TRITD|nr:unnamed protein product [Triticum turgidum subsp. durum]